MFAVIFCVLNVTQGVFMLVWSINQRKLKYNGFQLTDAFNSNIQYDFNKTLVLDNRPHSLVRFSKLNVTEREASLDHNK